MNVEVHKCNKSFLKCHFLSILHSTVLLIFLYIYVLSDSRHGTWENALSEPPWKGYPCRKEKGGVRTVQHFWFSIVQIFGGTQEKDAEVSTG